MRRDPDKARDYAARHNVPKWYDEADALIDDPEVDAVYIATPPDAHAAYTARVARASKPVYVEKPMARNHGECLAMVAACEEARVPLFVAYYRRALPAFLKVKSLVEDGAIGRVRCASIAFWQPASADMSQSQIANDDATTAAQRHLPWRVVPEISGGGYFFDLASHQLDFLDFLLGPIAHASGHAQNQAGLYQSEDAVTASFAFESGVLGSGTWSFAASDRRDQIEVIGDKGRIAFSTFAFTPVELTTEAGTQDFAFDPPQHVQYPLVQTVVDALLGRGECPSTGESAARTSRIMDQIVGNFNDPKK
jgi:predicted dehydrogenase